MSNVPHRYIRGGTTPGCGAEDSVRIGRIVRTYGEPGKFYRATNLYLFTPDRVRKVWCQFSDPVRDDNVRNREPPFADRTYGEQEQLRPGPSRRPRVAMWSLCRSRDLDILVWARRRIDKPYGTSIKGGSQASPCDQDQLRACPVGPDPRHLSRRLASPGTAVAEVDFRQFGYDS